MTDEERRLEFGIERDDAVENDFEDQDNKGRPSNRTFMDIYNSGADFAYDYQEKRIAELEAKVLKCSNAYYLQGTRVKELERQATECQGVLNAELHTRIKELEAKL